LNVCGRKERPGGKGARKKAVSVFREYVLPVIEEHQGKGREGQI